jgi:branched-subunit amino acid aminotransferase/4-amino-4-deoxychorismate lyase
MDGFWAYLNGNWIPGNELHVGVDDLGFLVGATVTERFRTFGGLVFRLDEHLQRLRHSLEIVYLDADAITRQVAAAVPEFVARNRDRLEPDDDWSIVAFATPGVSGSSHATVCVHGYPLPFQNWAAQFETGLPVVISRIRQVPSNCWPSELKCRSRMHFYLADRQASREQPGARAVLLDQDGYIAEATTANVIVYRRDEGLVSPPAEHILSGVSLRIVEQLAEKLNFAFVRRPLTVDEFRAADEALLTSTSICVQPIVACDGQPIGDGRPGPVYRQVLVAWSDFVAVDIAEQARRCSARRAR